MTIAGLSGNLWPIHLKPLPDELLSSWLVRLAHGHGLKLQSFCAVVFGRDRSMWNRDIDKLAPDWLIAKLAETTGTPLPTVMETTLRSYEGVVYEHHQPNGNTRWILPLGVYHRTRHSYGLLYCPHCLVEDIEPYFRKRWRLAFSTICTKHMCDLLDECPECAAPLAPHRADMHGKEFYPRGPLQAYCWKCSFNFRLAQSAAIEDCTSTVLQLRLESALDDGYIDWSGNPAMHSIVFFEGLRALIAGIATRQTLERLGKSSELNGIDMRDWPHAGLELAPLSARRELFRWLAVTLEDWPVNFVGLIHECGLRYSDLKGDSERRAFWYEDVIRREASGGYAPISQEEADAIARAVETKYGHFSGGLARELSGRDIAAHVSNRLQPVSDDVYEDLLTSIDHQIAGTLDTTERACLIRDKVMFAVGRQLRLSEQRLADLTLDQVRDIVPDEVDLDFSDVARSPAQARAWAEWYWEKIRPKLRPTSNIDRVFTSVRTQHGLMHSAVGVRFHGAVNAAMMQRSIQHYTYWIK